MGTSLLDKSPIWAQAVQMMAEVVEEQSYQRVNVYWKNLDGQ